MRWLGKAAGVLLIVAVVVTTGTTTSSAHTPADYFAEVWYQDEIHVYFDQNFPPSNPVYQWRERVMEGRSNWNIDATGRPAVEFHPSTSEAYFPCLAPPTNYLESVSLGVLDYPGNSIAETCALEYYGWILNAGIRIDEDENWYVNNSGSPPLTHYDLEAAMTHEFGHLYGWNYHFFDNSAVCPDPLTLSSRHTMCRQMTQGFTNFRTPEGHDVHTMAEAYN